MNTVQTNLGQLTATFDHPIWTNESGWKHMSNITIDDTLQSFGNETVYVLSNNNFLLSEGGFTFESTIASKRAKEVVATEFGLNSKSLLTCLAMTENCRPTAFLRAVFSIMSGVISEKLCTSQAIDVTSIVTSTNQAANLVSMCNRLKDSKDLIADITNFGNMTSCNADSKAHGISDYYAANAFLKANYLGSHSRKIANIIYKEWTKEKIFADCEFKEGKINEHIHHEPQVTDSGLAREHIVSGYEHLWNCYQKGIAGLCQSVV
jgi:hypothetical protein